MSKKILNEEVTFEDVGVQNRPIISKTNLKGIITFVNTPFCKLSGYSKEEVLGKPHNIIRHPDMPKKVFREMWNTILQGKEWNGIVKNLRKDGKYYWVDATITPIKDENNDIIGFISARRKVSDDVKKEYEKIYKEMREKEK